MIPKHYIPKLTKITAFQEGLGEKGKYFQSCYLILKIILFLLFALICLKNFISDLHIRIKMQSPFIK